MPSDPLLLGEERDGDATLDDVVGSGEGKGKEEVDSESEEGESKGGEEESKVEGGEGSKVPNAKGGDSSSPPLRFEPESGSAVAAGISVVVVSVTKTIVVGALPSSPSSWPSVCRLTRATLDVEPETS